jgi:hypothetical protein
MAAPARCMFGYGADCAEAGSEVEPWVKWQDC